MTTKTINRMIAAWGAVAIVSTAGLVGLGVTAFKLSRKSFGVKVVKDGEVKFSRGITTKVPRKSYGTYYTTEDIVNLMVPGFYDEKPKNIKLDSFIFNRDGYMEIAVPEKDGVPAHTVIKFFTLSPKDIVNDIFSVDSMSIGHINGRLTITSGEYDTCEVLRYGYLSEYFESVLGVEEITNRASQEGLLNLIREHAGIEPFIDKEVEVDMGKAIYSKSIGILVSKGIRIPVYVDGNIIRNFADEEIGRVRTGHSGRKEGSIIADTPEYKAYQDRKNEGMPYLPHELNTLMYAMEDAKKRMKPFGPSELVSFIDLPGYNKVGYWLSPLPESFTDDNMPNSFNELGEMLLDGGHIDYIVKEEQDITPRVIGNEDGIVCEEIDGISYIYKKQKIL